MPAMPEALAQRPLFRSPSLGVTVLENGRDELNLATYPLGAMLRNCPIHKEVKTDKNGDEEVIYYKMVEFQRRDPRLKGLVSAAIKVSTSSPNAFPQQEDEENLLTFICHAVNTDQLDSLRLKYNREDLLALRSHSDGGNNYTALDSTVERYYKADFEFINAWFDSESGDYLERFSFKIISERGIHRKKVGQDSPTSFFTWAPSFHKILQSTNLKALNLHQMFTLPRGATRYAYRFLDKRFCRGRFPEVTFEMEELARHCGLSLEQQTWKLKQTVKRILQDLQEHAFIDAFALEPIHQGGKRVKGKWRVRVNKAATSLPSPQQDEARQLAELFLQEVLQKGFAVPRRHVKPSEVQVAAKLLAKHGPLDHALFVKAARQQLKVTAPNAKMFHAVEWYLQEILKIYNEMLARQQPKPNTEKDGSKGTTPQWNLRHPEVLAQAAQLWETLEPAKRELLLQQKLELYGRIRDEEKRHALVERACLRELAQRFETGKPLP
jgi:hypothetical protein